MKISTVYVRGADNGFLTRITRIIEHYYDQADNWLFSDQRVITFDLSWRALSANLYQVIFVVSVITSADGAPPDLPMNRKYHSQIAINKMSCPGRMSGQLYDHAYLVYACGVAARALRPRRPLRTSATMPQMTRAIGPKIRIITGMYRMARRMPKEPSP